MFPSTRVARSGNIQHFHVRFKEQNASSTISPINLNITNNSCGAAKQTRKLTLQDSKPRRVNHVPICSNIPTTKVNTKLT